jgi:hypothetical protein
MDNTQQDLLTIIVTGIVCQWARMYYLALGCCVAIDGCGRLPLHGPGGLCMLQASWQRCPVVMPLHDDSLHAITCMKYLVIACYLLACNDHVRCIRVCNDNFITWHYM